MIQLKSAVLLFAAGMLVSAGILRADDATPVAKAAVTPAAVAAASTPVAKPDKPLSPLKAANALLGAGKYDEAISAYEKMGVQKFKKAETWRLNNEALCYLSVNPPAPEKAVPLLEKSVEADENNSTAWNNLGSAYEQTDALDKAKDAFQKAIDTASAAGVGSAKAETNLKGVQDKLDKIAAKNGGDNAAPAASTTPAAAAPAAASKTPAAK